MIPYTEPYDAPKVTVGDDWTLYQPVKPKCTCQDLPTGWKVCNTCLQTMGELLIGS